MCLGESKSLDIIPSRLGSWLEAFSTPQSSGWRDVDSPFYSQNDSVGCAIYTVQVKTQLSTLLVLVFRSLFRGAHAYILCDCKMRG